MFKIVEVKIIHAFSSNGQGGNPAGVVLGADHLSDREKQTVAAKTGLSETAFVSRSEEAEFKLDFFTPTRRIAHCGHATIAAFSHLRQLDQIKGDRSSKETIDGTRQIFFEGEMTYMEQSAPAFQVPDHSDLPLILRSLRTDAAALLTGMSPEIVNTGNSFLIVPFANVEELKGIRPDEELISKISEKYGLIGFYPFVPADGAHIDARARMFAPYYGIPEEAATGMAAGPLAAYLFCKGMSGKRQMQIAQGEFMKNPSPSLIRVNLELQDGDISRLFAGGNAYVSQSRQVKVDVEPIYG